MRESRSVQAWRSSRKLINAHVCAAVRALVSLFKRKRTWRSWHHDLESIRHDLESLCSDNDPRCHMRKIKIISSDWIPLLRRLLIKKNNNTSIYKAPFARGYKALLLPIITVSGKSPQSFRFTWGCYLPSARLISTYIVVFPTTDTSQMRSGQRSNWDLVSYPRKRWH